MQNNIKYQIKDKLHEIYNKHYTNDSIESIFNVLIKRSNDNLLKVINSNIDLIDTEIDNLIKLEKIKFEDKLHFCKNLNINSRIYIPEQKSYANITNINLPYIKFKKVYSTDSKIYEILYSKIGLEMICTKCSNKLNLFLKENINYKDLVCEKCISNIKYTPLLLTPNMFEYFNKDFLSEDKINNIKNKLLNCKIKIIHPISKLGPPPGLDIIPKYKNNLNDNNNNNIKKLELPSPKEKNLNLQLGSANLYNIQVKNIWDNLSENYMKRIMNWTIIKNIDTFILKKTFNPGQVFKYNNFGAIRNMSESKIYIEKNKSSKKVLIKIKDKFLKNIIKSMLLMEYVIENINNLIKINPKKKLTESFYNLLNSIYLKYLKILDTNENIDKDDKIKIIENNEEKIYYYGFIINCDDKHEKIFLENLVFGVNKIHMNILSKITEKTDIYLYNNEKKILNGVFRLEQTAKLNIINNSNYQNYQAQIKVNYYINKRQLVLENCFFGPCTMEHNNVLLKLFNK